MLRSHFLLIEWFVYKVPAVSSLLGFLFSQSENLMHNGQLEYNRPPQSLVFPPSVWPAYHHNSRPWWNWKTWVSGYTAHVFESRLPSLVSPSPGTPSSMVSPWRNKLWSSLIWWYNHGAIKLHGTIYNVVSAQLADRIFSHIGPVLWNKLPNSIRKFFFLEPFKMELKTLLFTLTVTILWQLFGDFPMFNIIVHQFSPIAVVPWVMQFRMWTLIYPYIISRYHIIDNGF